MKNFDLQSHSFSGKGYECIPAKCAEGKMALKIQSDGSGWKTSGMWLAEALNGRWTGRDRGYLFSPRRAQLWRRLYEAGFDANVRLTDKSPSIFIYNQKHLTEKEAVLLLERIEAEGKNVRPAPSI